MVIERALEKLRQSERAAGQNPAGHGAVPATPAVAYKREHAPVPTRKPVFPRVDYNRATAEAHRVLLPHTAIGEDSAVGAAYRMLRTRLLQRFRRNNWTSIAVTSPGPGDGKSLTTLNLAINLARDNASDVFVIDCDMRNPSICRYLGIKPPHEVTSYFQDEVSAQDLFFSIGIENLALAGGITTAERASELISTGKLEELIEHVRSIAPNPVVLIDLPPLLVTDEALLVAPRVDSTLLVVSEGKTRRDSLLRARQLLTDYTFAGVVLNRSSEAFGKESGYYYGYGYNGGSR